MVDNEEDDEELLAVFMEGLDMKSSRLELMLQRAQEQLTAAELEEREARQRMTKAKEQVGCKRSGPHLLPEKKCG